MDRTVLSKVSCASTAKVLVLYRYNGFILDLYWFYQKEF